MKIKIAATWEQKKDFRVPEDSSVDVKWVQKPEELWQQNDADAYLDLKFEKNHTQALASLLPKVIFINSVDLTLAETHENFIRINAWDGFLRGNLVEASARESQRPDAEALMRHLGKEIVWLPDVAGFVSARIVSMIINEAFFALEEGVSTKEEIDTALKLGTAYPYGPFEWAERIGVRKLAGLLQKLAADEVRYQPASLLLSEAE